MSALEPGTSNDEIRLGWEELARGAARGAGEDSEPELLRELLTFELAGSPYAIPIERVREIVRMRTITRMPRVPREVLGVIALRGEVVQVVDLRMRLGLATSEPARRTRVVVLHGDDDRVTGVLVDGVREVLRASEADIRPSTSAEGGFVSELCVNGDEFVSIIELDRVMGFDAGR